VAAYDSLADAILANKKTESNLVHSILATTYGHAQATMSRISNKLERGKNARTEIEKLATLVSQLANEGDASVAAVRKRLLEGGHHHHSSGEAQGIYEEGYVIVTRAAKKVFLDAGKQIGRLAQSPDKAALQAQWEVVSKTFAELTEGSGS